MKKLISGKVREVFDISDNKLVIVATDRISAYDVVLPKPVEDKGKILTAMSLFWFDYTKDIIHNHIISSSLSDMPEYFRKSEFEGRTVLVKKLKMLPVECVVRGYMFGSMWKPFKATGEFCGHKIEGSYELAEKLNEPLFTPSTKADIGHDEYITYKQVENEIGADLAGELRDISLKLYDVCYNYAYGKGIIIADTKFEFGLDVDDNLVLADEIFTPDSSRFWNLADYQIGTSPKSYDKQLVRDWLTNNEINGEMQFSNVPDEILQKTTDIYKECMQRLI